MIDPIALAGDGPEVGLPLPAERTRITSDDLFRLRLLHDVRIAPRGDRIAVSVHGVDRDLDDYVSSVQVIDLTTRTVTSLSPAGARDRSPRWAPGGDRLAFVSDRSGSEQLWLADLTRGAARPVTEVAGGVVEPIWSPDGTAIAFVSGSTISRPEPGANWAVRTARFKVDSRPVDGSISRRHIWLVKVDGTIGSPAVPLTEDADWHDSGPAWAPDGSTIAFLSNRSPSREFTETSAIHLLDPAIGAPSVRELRAPEGPLRALTWAPDGEAIAAIGHRRGDAQGVDDHVLVYPLDGREPRSLTAHLGLSAGMFVRGDEFRSPPAPLSWPRPGGQVYTCTVDHGRPVLGSIDVSSGVFRPIAEGSPVLAFSVTDTGDALAWIRSTPTEPGEIRLELLPSGEGRALTLANPWLRGRSLAEVRLVTHESADGSTVDGWLYRHPDVPAGSAPLVLTVHGGPHYPVGERFSLEWQRLAALDLLVLAPNPRGSQGYGEQFATATWGDWGGGDYADLMGIVDDVVASGEADRTRLGITGVSYGGFMTNWAISHGDRFRAAIAENSICDLWSAFGVSGEHCAFWISDMAGAPWDEPDRYTAQSPITHVRAIRTPLLLIHAENDHNCPIAQAEELFVALRYLGREVEFLRLPGEGHLMNLYGRPSRRLGRMAAIDGWWARHLLAEAPATPSAT